MHNRLKILSNAKREADKKAERERKLKAYVKCSSRLLELRNEGEGRGSPEGEIESLKLSAGLLGGNPDIATFWNIRKEICTREGIEKAERIVERECELTKRCLEAQPKSYCTWHHRGWVLTRFEQEESFWKKELGICDEYLTLDERNFHCWDYRRFVLSHLKNECQTSEELRFSMDKIKANFSNYSAWHYRSRLLENEILKGKCLPKGELILTEHAAFTDPEDSSHRFYHQWLINSFSYSHLSPKFFKDIQVVALPKAVVEEFKIFSDLDSEISKTDIGDGVLWKLETSTLIEDLKFVFPHNSGISDSDCMSRIGPNVMATLKEDLTNYNELLGLEPDSKWTRYTIMTLMRALNPVANFDNILKEIDKLIELDTLRKGYYLDMKSKFISERKLMSIGDGSKIDLSGVSLTRIDYPQYFYRAEQVILSNNRLKSIKKLEGFLANCTMLNLDDNECLEKNWFNILNSSKKLKVVHCKNIPIPSIDALRRDHPKIKFVF